MVILWNMAARARCSTFHKTTPRGMQAALLAYVRARTSSSSKLYPMDELAIATLEALDEQECDWFCDRLEDLVWAIGHQQRSREAARAPELPEDDRVVSERKAGGVCYRLELRACGKPKCKCARGELHGPYWYGYSRAGGKLRKEYIGKTLSGVADVPAVDALPPAAKSERLKFVGALAREKVRQGVPRTTARRQAEKAWTAR